MYRVLWDVEKMCRPAWRVTFWEQVIPELNHDSRSDILQVRKRKDVSDGEDVMSCERALVCRGVTSVPGRKMQPALVISPESI